MHDVRRQGTAGLLASNSMLNLAGKVLPMAVGVLTIPYIVRGLGTDGFGILSIALMLLGYFGIFDLGLSRATTKFVAAHLHQDKLHKLPALIWTSLLIQTLVGVTGALLLAAFVPILVDRIFKMPTAWVSEAKLSLFILCSAVPILLASNALRGVLEAKQRFDLVNYVTVPASVSFYLLAAGGVSLGIRVSGIIALMVVTRLIAAAAYMELCLRVFPLLRQKISLSREAIRPLASFGGWVMVSNTIGPVFGYLERFLIATGLSVGMLSYYSVPFELVSKGIIFPASIAPVLFPLFSYHGSGPDTIVSDVSSRTIKYLLFVMTPVTAVFVCFGREVLRIWLGVDFASQSTVVLQLLAIAFFLNAVAYVPYTSVQALGRPDLKAILDVISLPLYAICAWWLIQRMGINGAALAKLLVTFVDVICLFAFARSLKAFSLSQWASGPLCRALVTSGGLFVSLVVISCLHSTEPTSLVLVLSCLICYTVIFWLLAVDRVEKVTVVSYLRSRLYF